MDDLGDTDTHIHRLEACIQLSEILLEGASGALLLKLRLYAGPELGLFSHWRWNAVQFLLFQAMCEAFYSTRLKFLHTL